MAGREQVRGGERAVGTQNGVVCGDAAVALLDEATADRLAETFRVLSDPTRVRIISALAEGALCVHELASALALTHSAVSHQLAMLREMRLVTFDKEGRHVIYALDDQHIHDLYRQGLEHIRHGEPRAGRGECDPGT